MVPRRFRSEVSKAGEIVMQGGVPKDVKSGNKFRAALAVVANNGTTFQEEYAKLVSTYHSLLPVAELEKMTIEEMDSITDSSLKMARLRRELNKKDELITRLRDEIDKKDDEIADCSLKMARLHNEPEPEQKRGDLVDSTSEEDIKNIIDREMSSFHVPGKSPNGPFGQQFKDGLLDLFEVKDAAEQDDEEGGEEEKNGGATIQERAMRPSTRDDDESTTEADEAERLENEWIQGMQRWVIRYDCKTSTAGCYGTAADLVRLGMPCKQTYVIQMDFSKEMTKDMILVAFDSGVAACRDKYQWRAADGKERSLEGQARALQLAQMYVARQAVRDRFGVFAIQLDTPLFRGNNEPLFDVLRNIWTDERSLRFPCVDCGKDTATVCTRCDYPYCKETCLRAHIEKSKSCKCRQQHKDCNPCRANATFKKLHGLKKDAPRVYACYGCRGSLAEGKSTSCPGCWVPRYCSRKCQVKHWNKGGHKQRCSLWRKWKLKYGAINKKLAKVQGKRE